MWREAFRRYWDFQGIYFTKVYRPLYVGIAITAYFYYQLSYGGKKKQDDKLSDKK